MSNQLLFSLHELSPPRGFSYHPDFISKEEEQEFLRIMKSLTFSSFEMRGVEAKRKIIHYGMKYDFLTRSAHKIPDIPAWIQNLKRRSESLLKKEVSQILLTHYPVGAAIGWHFDAPPFESLLGVSLQSECRFQLRKGEGSRGEKFEMNLEPHSAYVIQGESRNQWQHHIPPVKEPRYSITLRTLI